MKSNLIKFLAVFLIFGLMAATGAIAGDSSVTGIVDKMKNGIVIIGDDGATYKVSGTDLSEMVGKVVKATGTLAEGPDGKTLTVVSVEPAQK